MPRLPTLALEPGEPRIGAQSSTTRKPRPRSGPSASSSSRSAISACAPASPARRAASRPSPRAEVDGDALAARAARRPARRPSRACARARAARSPGRRPRRASRSARAPAPRPSARRAARSATAARAAANTSAPERLDGGGSVEDELERVGGRLVEAARTRPPFPRSRGRRFLPPCARASVGAAPGLEPPEHAPGRAGRARASRTTWSASSCSSEAAASASPATSSASASCGRPRAGSSATATCSRGQQRRDRARPASNGAPSVQLDVPVAPRRDDEDAPAPDPRRPPCARRGGACPASRARGRPPRRPASQRPLELGGHAGRGAQHGGGDEPPASRDRSPDDASSAPERGRRARAAARRAPPSGWAARPGPAIRWIQACALSIMAAPAAARAARARLVVVAAPAPVQRNARSLSRRPGSNEPSSRSVRSAARASTTTRAQAGGAPLLALLLTLVVR